MSLSSLRHELTLKREELRKYRKRKNEVIIIVSALRSDYVDDIDGISSYVQILTSSVSSAVNNSNFYDTSVEISKEKEEDTVSDTNLSGAINNLNNELTAIDKKIEDINRDIENLERSIEREEEESRRKRRRC